MYVKGLTIGRLCSIDSLCLTHENPLCSGKIIWIIKYDEIWH